MKAITIHQPWATLIALGEKEFETRGWPTKYRGPFAIHAAKKVDKDICQQEPFRSVLAKHGYVADNLPIGAIVAVGELVDCLKVTGEAYDIVTMEGDAEPHFLPVKSNEYHFGYYDKGRYAWEMADVKSIDPVPAKGQQGLWNWGGEWDAGRT